MPIKYIITGRVLIADDNRPLVRGRVQAFDRDLPSLERRGFAPQLLGEAELGASDVFQIEYSEEQFQEREAAGLNIRRQTKSGPDLSFTVYSSQGKILDISKMVMNEREFRPDQIIFNAPTELKVDIYVKASETSALSEYDLLTGLLAQIVGNDLPLADLTMEDLEFAFRELGFDVDVYAATDGRIEKSEQAMQSLIWLVRSVQLSRLSQINAEAFYGWGRMNVPAMLVELCKISEPDVPMLIGKLGSLSDQELTEALFKAIEENIIPVSLHEQVDLIIRQLKHHGQVLREVSGQLLDRETGQGLEGFRVTTVERSGTEEELGLDVTGSDGSFSFAFYVPEDVPHDAPDRLFTFKVIMPDGTELPESDRQPVSPNQPQGEAVQIFIHIPHNPAPTLELLQQTGQADFPVELVHALKEREITSFAAIRRAGGVRAISGLPPVDAIVLDRLDALADLDRISPDVTVSKGLLDNDFNSVLAIADTPYSEFVSKLSNAIPLLKEQDTLKLHVMASTQTHLINNILMTKAGNQANGYKLLEAEGAEPVAGLIEQHCSCSACKDAMSPAAYLTALLDYALKHIRIHSTNKIDLQFLADTFYQPFSDLPLSCEATEKQVRQARISIEVLRKYMGIRPLADPAKEETLVKAEEGYRFTVYSQLLNRIGTSYEELRRIHLELPEIRKSLADRIGISLTETVPVGPLGDELDQLLFDPGKHALTEQVLEKLFGLADTTRDPLSEGAKLGDEERQITRWNLDGTVWVQNTDPEGLIYVKLVNQAANVFRVELYKDQSHTSLVASGEIATASGTVNLVQENNSRLSGLIEIDYTVGSRDISIAAIPTFLSWQLKHLRTLWSQQDHPKDVYSGDDTFPVLPIIDPDLIGPDDFRNPYQKLNPTDQERAFDIWLKRREFVDTTLNDLKASHETNGLTAILEQVLGNPLPDLDGLLAILYEGDADEIKIAKGTIVAHHLTVESFKRLMDIRTKDRLSQIDNRNDKISAAEWSEVYSILAQAAKEKQFAVWRTEEQDAGVYLGLKEFWFSLREPQAGDWPIVPIANQPFIDPDLVKPSDLPDSYADKEAFVFWTARKVKMDQIVSSLKHERETNGFEAMLQLAIGNPLPGNHLQHNLDILKSNLSSPDENARGLAVEQIENDLHMTVENFKRLMIIIAANDQPVPEKKPTEAEWDEVYAILASARKLKHEYPVWIQEEENTSLVYWKAVKTSLPLWRANLEARRTWQQALRVRSQRPIIDPTVMGADDLLRVVPGNPAFDIWKARYDQRIHCRNELKMKREAEADFLTGLNQIIEDSLGCEIANVDALEQKRLAGHPIAKRLEQLNIVNGSFIFLMGMRALAEAGEPITDSEWGTVYDTLAQVKIQREFAEMRVEEQEQQIVHSPDFFKIPETTMLPSFDLSTQYWLSTRQARSEWQDTLQSRMDQENSVVGAFRNVIGTTEEMTLPVLRDALIQATDAAGENIGEKAEWVTGRLLIDAKSGECQITTRIAQATETIQTLIFNLRTGQFKHLNTLPLSLISDHFDEEWKWIGSYSSWRAAMFVYLIPEISLQPSLLKFKSPVLQTLMNNTRIGQLDPKDACKEAKAYADYFRDICSLEIEATCQASTIIYEGNSCDKNQTTTKSMFYMFGRAKSGKIYWSAYTVGDNYSTFNQTFWKEIEGFRDSKVIRIIGAMPYRKGTYQKRDYQLIDKFSHFGYVTEFSYIHIFFLTVNNSQQNLKLARLNLDNFSSWDENIYDLSLPPLNVSSLAIVPVQTQSETTPPSLIFHKYGTGSVYYRKLNLDGNAWEQNGNDLYYFQLGWGGYTKETKIEAVLRATSDLLWFVTSSSTYLNLDLIKLQPSGAIGVRSGIKTWSFGAADFLGAVPGSVYEGFIYFVLEVAAVYIFWRDASGSHYRRFTYELNDSVYNGKVYGELNNPVHGTLTDLIQIPPHSGNGSNDQHIVAYKRRKNAQAYYMYQYTEDKDKLIGSNTIRAVPRVQAPLNIPNHLTAAELQKRRKEINHAFLLNVDATSSVLAYLHEAYYFVPMHLALALQRSGQYLDSLDWFRTFYDYEAQTGTPNQRNIYYGLEMDSKLPDVPIYQQADGWLLDPLNPHFIAATRRYAYTRFTIMSLVKCFLDYADSEFTQENLANARTLYVTALSLLDLPELKQKLGVCDNLIAELKIEPGKDIPPEVPPAIGEIMEELTKNGTRIFPYLSDVVYELKTIFSTAANWNEKLAEAREVVQIAVGTAPEAPAIGSIVTMKQGILHEKYKLLMTQPDVDVALQNVSRLALNKYLIHAEQALHSPQNLLQLPGGGGITPSLQFCVPPNPMLRALRTQAELNLSKLRSCRNIAGIKREVDPYFNNTGAAANLPVIVGGQLALPGIDALRPSLYRYSTLIERAKQLVQLAAQIEANMLNTLEKRDAEAYNLFKARQEWGVAQANIRLQDLRVKEANTGVNLAKSQQSRAQIQFDHFVNLLMDTDGMSQLEESAMIEFQRAIEFQTESVSYFWDYHVDPGVYGVSIFPPGLSYSVPNSDSTKAALEGSKAALSNMLAELTLNRASLERNRQEWELQKSLASQDLTIGAQQIQIATDQVEVVLQEKVIAALQFSNMNDTLEFISNKFSNENLYDFMSGVLESVYRYFLIQATAIAKSAENQLAFERQGVLPYSIKSDYWIVTSDGTNLNNANDKSPDRKGLTGSARLFQDIYQLDQYAFLTNQRKMPLTKTFSLAQLEPYAFQQFRDKGVIIFTTPMELFDRDFPGHYLRLIKRVRTSVIALIPPTQGIHATLSTIGISRVVIGPDIFQTVPIRRDPEIVALSSPVSTAGVYELEPQQPDMLFPFEGSGVETKWEFRMPKAANQFDYSTIADVLFTIEYTALHSFDYAQQIIQTLNPNLSAERSFSFRNQFADQWYDLHNPEQTKTPMKVFFQTVREDFPPNIENLKIQQVLLYFVCSSEHYNSLPVTKLYFIEQNHGSIGGSATPIDGIISTRRGNAGSWTMMLGTAPVGEWVLELPNTEEVRNLFKDEIDDILLVMTYSGKTPEWPA